MVLAAYLDPRYPKANHWMLAFAAGCNGVLVEDGRFSESATDHCVMGNWPVAHRLVKKFKERGIGFWYLDSSYIQGLPVRYLRVERNRFWPELKLRQHNMARVLSMGVRMAPWRRSGNHVLIALHGRKFGWPWNIDIKQWNATIEERVRAMTDRPIVVRLKPNRFAKTAKAPPFEEHLRDAWCVVVHSSGAGVQAVLSGVPVFCESTCAASMVGNLDLAQIETPTRPDRELWLAELAWRQWSETEMNSGEAWAHLKTEMA